MLYYIVEFWGTPFLDRHSTWGSLVGYNFEPRNGRVPTRTFEVVPPQLYLLVCNLHELNIYPLVICYIAMGNGPFIDGLPINSMVIFHGYVK